MNRLGVTLPDSVEKFEQLNMRLEENNFLLLVNLHPAEDTTNMAFTDYSSVYYDYLFTGRPIGLVIDDLAEYSKRDGFFYGEYKDLSQQIEWLILLWRN